MSIRRPGAGGAGGGGDVTDLVITTASGTAPVGDVIMVLKVEASALGRVRFYRTAAGRTVDVARGATVDYTGTDCFYDWSPTAGQYDPDGSAQVALLDGSIYWTVSNGITVTLQYLPLT